MRSLRDVVRDELQRRKRIVASNESHIPTLLDGEKKIASAIYDLPQDLVALALEGIRNKRFRVASRLEKQKIALEGFERDAKEFGIW